MKSSSYRGLKEETMMINSSNFYTLRPIFTRDSTAALTAHTLHPTMSAPFVSEPTGRTEGSADGLGIGGFGFCLTQGFRV